MGLRGARNRRAGLKTGGPSQQCCPTMVEAAGIEPASESLRQRRLHAYPGCGGNPRPEAPFPVSAPRRINPANRAVGPIPESHQRLGRTAGQARLVDVLSRPAGVVRKDVA